LKRSFVSFIGLKKLIVFYLIIGLEIKMEKLEIRVLLRHYWKQNLKATEAVKKICEVEGEDVISNRTAQNWFKRFNDGDTSLEDEPRSGSPVTVDSEALREAVGANSATSTL
jgi:transposase